MNQTEAASIVAYLNRAGLLWAMVGQAAVWSDALGDVSFVTAQEVVRDMAANRTSAGRSVTPGDVREAVRTIRNARLAVMRTPEPPAEDEPIPTGPVQPLAFQMPEKNEDADTLGQSR